jgi:hypothetical protein
MGTPQHTALGCHVGDLIWGAAMAGGTLDALEASSGHTERALA